MQCNQQEVLIQCSYHIPMLAIVIDRIKAREYKRNLSINHIQKDWKWTLLYSVIISNRMLLYRSLLPSFLP
jgi:hypothetical protein